MDARYRHELKYLVTAPQVAVLRSRIGGLITIDPHIEENGKYNISSLYFDDYYDRCFYENENGTDPREKFRIRIYNHSCDRIALELKRKECGKTLKQSTLLPMDIAQSIIKGESISGSEKSSALLQKLSLEMRLHLLHPVVIVEYERYPYVYRNGNVRITFDTNISSSSFTKDFLSGTYPKRPIMPNGLQLMEVKYDEYLPDFIYKALELENLQQTAYSKYYLCRKYNIK